MPSQGFSAVGAAEMCTGMQFDSWHCKYTYT
jgi:hypothetical protein